MTSVLDTSPASAWRRPFAQTMAMTAVAIRDRIIFTIVIAVAMIAMGALTGSLWPSLQDAFTDLPPAFNEGVSNLLAGADLTTGAGWMNAELISLVAPGGLTAVAILSAARGIAGEEQKKTLGVLLSAPVSRTVFLTAKTFAMVVNVLLATIALAAGIVIGSLIGDLGISASGVLGTCAHSALLAIVFGAIAVLIAALTGDGRLSSTIPTGLAVLAFALNAFLPLSEPLADYTKATPWYYFAASNPLVNGPDHRHLLVLAVGAFVLLIAAVLAYQRRNLRG